MLTKIYKKDCIGRVPASIRELEECELCENEDICLSLMGASQVVRGASSSKVEDDFESRDREKANE